MWYLFVQVLLILYLIHIVVHVDRHFPLLYGIRLQHSYIFHLFFWKQTMNVFLVYLKQVEISKCVNLTINLNNFKIFNFESDYRKPHNFCLQQWILFYISTLFCTSNFIFWVKEWITFYSNLRSRQIWALIPSCWELVYIKL